MLLNQQQLRELRVIPGTRMLEDPLGLQGVSILDYKEPWRQWTIQWVLAPVRGRIISGIRAKLVDTKGFVSFINQRDLEVTLGHGQPGKYCQWLGMDYAGPEEDEWFGVCCDTEDLKDDLFERECWIRQQLQQHQYLPTGLELERLVHFDEGNDAKELLTLRGDVNQDTGQYPDPRLETVMRRWTRVEKVPLIWERT